jgi:endonuclease G, mitochondrial
MLVSIEQLNNSAGRFELWKGKSVRSKVSAVPEEELFENLDETISKDVRKGNILGKDENLVKRKEMITSIGQEPADFAYERAIGNNDSVYSNFVELIVIAKKKVGRIVLKNGVENIGYATGFMVSDDLLLTNWHVFEDKESVADSEVQFFYELDTMGNPGDSVSFKLNASDFFYSFKELDYCFIAVNKTDVTGTTNLSSVGYIHLDPVLGKLGNEGEEKLNIIHHPDGDYKQLSIRENKFTKILPTTLWYECDTASGSSGSPVFNDQWQVVALHHMGVAEKNEQGDYIDKNGKIIPQIGNKIDESRIHWIANEGIRISVILKDIFNKYPDSGFIKNLQFKPHETKPLVNGKKPENGQKKVPMETTSVNISFPASLLEQEGNVTISINNTARGAQIPVLKSSDSDSGGMVEDFAEVKKTEIEDGMDYSGCKGYQSNFLGTEIPLPQPDSSIKKFIARLKGSDSIVLKYQHYSVIFNSVRMMPLISAINVDGDSGKRLDFTKRGTDVWLRDNRLEYDYQLNDKYYKGSGFDKGHMSRREDANWGFTSDDARRFADLTCMYTNACPQINTLNQSQKKGLWGKLENGVLEYGAIKQKGKEARISVFNGPIFKETDPVFRRIQVPMEFYKIILWLNDKSELKATAFKLTQTDLVGDIDFEALDINENVEFKAYQCSIKSLKQNTKLDFSAIIKYDTYDKTNDNESLLITSEEELKIHLKKQNTIGG